MARGARGNSWGPVPRAGIKIKLPKRLPRHLTRGELRAILSAPVTSDFSDFTTRVAVELLFDTGVRVSELAALRDTDVDLDGAVITILGKGDRQRRVHIPDTAVVDLLNSYRSARHAHHARTDLFLINSGGMPTSANVIRRLVRRHAERAELSRRVTPHMFRHSVATYLLEVGVDIRYVQRLLGHRSISTTEIYTHVADAALKSRIVECHPRRGILDGRPM
jgi:integrase/recombinase XerC